MSLRFLSIGANKISQASDYNDELDLVVFGAGRTLALWTPEGKLHGTAKGHTKTITAVKFLGKNNVVSGSDDGTIKLWRIDKHRLVLIQSITVLKSVTCISVKRNKVVFGCMDGTISMWSLNAENSLELTDKITINSKFYPLCLSICFLADDKILLAAGGSFNLVHILCLENKKLSLKCSLEGHDDWIRAVDFHQVQEDLFYLASGSQDRYIRIWNIHLGQDRFKESRTEETDLLSAEDEMITNKVYQVDDHIFITFEALLMGHDDWVVAMRWHPNECSIISASSDSSLIIWKPQDEFLGGWICAFRSGELSIKGSSTATGSSGGFWGLIVAEKREMIAVVTKTGSWRLWVKNGSGDDYKESIGITGHIKAVTDCSWEDHSEYLLTTSLDQTTRLWAARKNDPIQYYEMARPQIHGYDMVAVKSLSRRIFVSAGDEKTVRVFQQPKHVAKMLENVCGAEGETSNEHLPGSATVPALGLSNKDSIDDGNVEEATGSSETTGEILDICSEPSKESYLQRQTLFPELEKLYGHGYEISCIEVSHDKCLLATCCKANNELHAIIRVYDTKTWRQIEPSCGPSHVLTITRLRFSPNDEYLLSVSRDRKFTLWKREGLHLNKHYENAQSHSRILWDCAWVNDELFLTVSRDKTVALWSVDNPEKPLSQLKFAAPVTAVDFKLVGAKHFAAVGLETGQLYLVEVTDKTLVLHSNIDTYDNPDLRVNRISWSSTKNVFAVASEDNSVRIYSIE